MEIDGVSVTNIVQGGVKIGEKIGVSNWLEITQEDINLFAEVTKDMDPMHIDAQAAAKGPFGQTISFGFYTLSLLTYFSHEITQWETIGPALNYGFDNVRFINPVPVGSRIRAHFSLKDRREKPNGGLITVFDVLIEIEGEEKPALVAEWLGLVMDHK